MTAIIWKDNKLLVDSFVEKGGEWMEVSDKVMIVRREMKLVSKSGSFDDHILGITYTGARFTAERFGQALHQATLDMLESMKKITANNIDNPDPIKYSYETVMERYTQAKDLGLFNLENNFTALLIGARGAYVAMLTLDNGLAIEEISSNEAIYMGSGSTYMRDLDKRNDTEAEPIRMMHFAFLMEPGCGGRISLFERVRDDRHPSKKALTLTGLYEPPDAAQLRAAELAAKSPAAPDLILNPRSYRSRRRSGETAGVSIDEGDDHIPSDVKSEEELKSEQQARVAEAARNAKRPAKVGKKKAGGLPPRHKVPAKRTTTTKRKRA